MAVGRTRVLVLGGGFAGMFAAKELQRRVAALADVELINAVNYFVYQPLLPEVAAGAVSIRDAVSPLRRLLPGVRVRQALIWDIDLERQVAVIFQGSSGATPRCRSTIWWWRSGRAWTCRAFRDWPTTRCR